MGPAFTFGRACEVPARTQKAERQLEPLRRERDLLIVAATQAGASRRKLAAALDLTPMRVQQILERAERV